MNSPSRSPRTLVGTTALALAAALGLALVVVALARGSGNAHALESGYGSSMGSSVNGTGAFAALLRTQGHNVRTAWRLTAELAGWADVIVRFAFAPGPPDREEARWYDDWLESRPERAVVYVVRDYDAQEEYWKLVLDQLSGSPHEERRKQAESNRDRARNWVPRLPDKEEKPAGPESWFAVGRAADPPRRCKRLGGPWAEDIDAESAALIVHEPLKAGQHEVLLTGDGEVLALEWEVDRGSRVLAIANGSFLLNLPLVNPARRPLAQRVVEWIGEEPRRVAFVEGPRLLGESEVPPTLIDLVARIRPFRWVALHLGLFGLLACLARAPRLGRPSPDAPSDADRPAAHAEAVGALLERSHGAATARDLLETYRRWRFPRTSQEAGRPPETIEPRNTRKRITS
ncbi:MAG: hypothetical protein ACXWNF_10355 [Isosphaeraceae bacterium]